MNDASDTVFRNRFIKFLELLPNFEKAFEKLLKLTFAKYQLKESARIRPVRFFKTGNVKDQIDILIPDAELSAIAHELSKSYKYMNYLGADGIRLYFDFRGNKTILHEEEYKKDGAKINKLLEKPTSEIEYASINNT